METITSIVQNNVKQDWVKTESFWDIRGDVDSDVGSFAILDDGLHILWNVANWDVFS